MYLRRWCRKNSFKSWIGNLSLKWDRRQNFVCFDFDPDSYACSQYKKISVVTNVLYITSYNYYFVLVWSHANKIHGLSLYFSTAYYHVIILYNWKKFEMIRWNMDKCIKVFDWLVMKGDVKVGIICLLLGLAIKYQWNICRLKAADGCGNKWKLI